MSLSRLSRLSVCAWAVISSLTPYSTRYFTAVAWQQRGTSYSTVCVTVTDSSHFWFGAIRAVALDAVTAPNRLLPIQHMLGSALPLSSASGAGLGGRGLFDYDIILVPQSPRRSSKVPLSHLVEYGGQPQKASWLRLLSPVNTVLQYLHIGLRYFSLFTCFLNKKIINVKPMCEFFYILCIRYCVPATQLLLDPAV